MAKRKQKITPFQNQKLAKAHHKKEFIRKLKLIINTIYGKEVCSKIPEITFNNLYDKRAHTFRLDLSKKTRVPQLIINHARKTISEWSRLIKVDLIPGKLEITLDEFFTIALSVSINLDHFLEQEKNPSLLSLRKSIQKFNNDLEITYAQANEMVFGMLLTIAMYFSDLGSIAYCFNHDVKPSPNMVKGIDNIISIHAFKSETISVAIENISRPVKRLGHAFPKYGMQWISLKPSQLNIANTFSELSMDVYIQNHALQRLSERIDCFPTGIIQFNLYSSMLDPKVFYNSRQDILVEYRFLGTKAGYFSVDIIEGKVIIKTFLFVTNNGTPEGEKLAKITGLQRLDKKYLAIDKLSTFMSSGLSENEEVKKILISAGCECLVELYEKKNEISTHSPKEFNAERLLKYIGYNKGHFPESKQ